MIPKKNPHQKRSKLQERKGARDYSGTQNSGSGNGWIRKADIRTEFETVEFKTTTKSTFTVRSAELRKLWDYALVDGRRPVFEVEFANDGVTCVILDKNDYMTIRESKEEEG